MSVKTIYSCDRCSKEIEGDNQLWNISIQYKCHPQAPGDTDYHATKIQWCRPCMEEFDCLLKKKERLQVPPPPSISEQLELILGELVREHQDVCRHG